MAAAATFSAGKLLILVGDGGGTEAFTEPCAILNATMTLSKELSEQVIPDCADPDATGWVERDAISHSMSLSFDGLATNAGLAALNTIMMGTASRNMRVQFVGGGSGGATPDYRWSGAFHITSLEITRTRGERLSFSAEIVSDGTVTAASVAALS